MNNASHTSDTATGDSFRTIALSYQVGHSTACGIVKEVASAIWATLVEEMQPVPTLEDGRVIDSEFQEGWQFPNCLGVLFQAPHNTGSLFFSDNPGCYRSML